jgi:hypothetical protein
LSTSTFGIPVVVAVKSISHRSLRPDRRSWAHDIDVGRAATLERAWPGLTPNEVPTLAAGTVEVVRGETCD